MFQHFKNLKETKFVFNTDCNFTNSISQFFFSFFSLFIELIIFGLIYIDLVASYCIVRGLKESLCACMCSDGKNDIRFLN